MAIAGLGAFSGFLYKFYMRHIKPGLDQFKSDIIYLKTSVNELKEDVKKVSEKVNSVERETRTNGGSTLKDDLKLIKAQTLINSKATDSMLYLYGDPFFKADTQGNFTFVNHKFLQLTGLIGSEDANGIGWLKAVCENDRHRVYTEWINSVTTESIFVCNFKLCNLITEEVTEVAVRTTPIRDEKNQILLYMGIIELK